MKGSYQVGKAFGIPIKVHISLLVLIPFFALHLTGIGLPFFWSLLAVIGLFGSVALHELGHSVVALIKGIRVRQILLLPIGGIAQLIGSTPKPKDEVQIAIAGPAVSMILALLTWPVHRFLTAIGLQHLGATFLIISVLNLFLALFNLIPSFPMDGGRVLRALLTPRLGRLESTRLASKIGRYLAVFFGVLGILKLNLLWIAIAVFIYFAAGSEYRMVQFEEMATRHSGWFGMSPPGTPPPTDDQSSEVYVSPPPYERGSKPPKPNHTKSPFRFVTELFNR